MTKRNEKTFKLKLEISLHSKSNRENSLATFALRLLLGFMGSMLAKICVALMPLWSG